MKTVGKEDVMKCSSSYPFVSKDADLKNCVFDLYLFVNPLGPYCYQCEKELLSFIEGFPYKAYFRFITFHNLSTVTTYMKRKGLDTTNIDLRNTISTNIYDAALSYKAALLQGKKVGQQFLIALQHAVNVEGIPYSQALVDQLVRETGLDATIFYEDKHSDLVRMEYENDQLIAHEMHIQRNPSLVIFNNVNHEYGVLLDQEISAHTIEQVCLQLFSHHDTGLFRKISKNKPYTKQFLQLLKNDTLAK